MARVEAFRALRYDEASAGPLQSLVSPPYDVIGPGERERLLAQSPYNVVHLTLPDSEDEAARKYREWQRDGILVTEAEAALWGLEQEYVGPDGVHRKRRGFAAAVEVEPYSARVILPHERTHRGPREGRLRLLRAVRAQLEPIFLLYEGSAATGEVLAEAHSGKPAVEVEGAGSTTRAWRVSDPDVLASVKDAFAARTLLIADGHHRYETALAFHAEDGSARSAFILAVLVDTRDPGLMIFPTHRVVPRVPELDGGFRSTPVSEGPEDAVRALERLPRNHPAFVLYRAGQSALVEAPAEGGLDAAALDRLGLEEVTYTPRAEEAIALVDSGAAEGAFLLRPTTIEQVAAVAEAGETMPQKSTYFYPKLVSGLLILPV